LVPPALEGGGIDTHRQQVWLSRPRGAADVDAERRVPARVAADLRAVEPDPAVAIDAVELEPEHLPRRRCGNRGLLPIPCRLDGQEAMAQVRLRVERPFDDVVVRDVDPLPPGVVIEWGERAGAPDRLLVQPLQGGAPDAAGPVRVFDQNGKGV